jgi:predicted O-linked N-acetylglucosamine transferase (SPINDLY family)
VHGAGSPRNEALERCRVWSRLKSQADRWIPIARRDDRRVAARVREDQIDILVDLGGYAASSRIEVFALNPTPVQVAWLGYPNTTGINNVDYRLTDDIVDPSPGRRSLLQRDVGPIAGSVPLISTRQSRAR